MKTQESSKYEQGQETYHIMEQGSHFGGLCIKISPELFLLTLTISMVIVKHV